MFNRHQQKPSQQIYSMSEAIDALLQDFKCTINPRLQDLYGETLELEQEHGDTVLVNSILKMKKTVIEDTNSILKQELATQYKDLNNKITVLTEKVIRLEEENKNLRDSQCRLEEENKNLRDSQCLMNRRLARLENKFNESADNRRIAYRSLAKQLNRLPNGAHSNIFEFRPRQTYDNLI